MLPALSKWAITSGMILGSRDPDGSEALLPKSLLSWSEPAPASRTLLKLLTAPALFVKTHFSPSLFVSTEVPSQKISATKSLLSA